MLNHTHCVGNVSGRRCNHHYVRLHLNGQGKATKTKNKENYKQETRTLLAGPGKAGRNANLMSNIFHVELTLFNPHYQVRTKCLQVKNSYNFNGPRNIFLALHWVVSRGNAIYIDVSYLFSIYIKNINTPLFRSSSSFLKLNFPD